MTFQIMHSGCEYSILGTPSLRAILTVSRFKFDEKQINVMHYITKDCTGTLLDSPTRSMLLTFCGLFRDRLDEILEIEKAQASSSGFYWIDLIGCELESVSAICVMIEWWCDGLKTLPVIRQATQFAGLSQLYQAAQMLQVPNAMFKVIGKRLDHVIENKIPTAEDLAAMYEDFPKGHDARRYTLDAWMDGLLLEPTKRTTLTSHLRANKSCCKT